MSFSLLLPVLAIAAGNSNQIVVPTIATSGVDASVGPVVTELVLEALLNRHGIRALGPGDVKDMLTAEQQRQLMGCDQSSCMAQIAGAMGARNLVSGMVGKLGSTFVVTLKLVDTETAKVSRRASRRFKTLDGAPDAVGPLVDDLLNRKPKVQSGTPRVLLERHEKQKKKKVMSVAKFCDRGFADYRKGLEKGRYSKALMRQRKKLLEDVMWTPFLEEMQKKAACIESAQKALSAELHNQWLSAKEKVDSMDAERRHLELAEMTRTLALLKEAYELGLEKEKNGTGARPVQLPFEIDAPIPDPRPKTAEITDYRKRFLKAQTTIADALRAVDKNDKRRFVALWTPAPKKKRRYGKALRKEPRDMWIEALRYSDSFDLDACPLYILDAERLTQGAKTYRENGKLEGCVRKVDKKTGQASTEKVLLERTDGRWRIAVWK